MVLARPIPLPSDPHRFLLQRDREIPLDLVPRLRQWGVSEVWVRCHDLEFLEDIIEVDLSDRQQDVYRNVRRNFEAVMRDPATQLDLEVFQQSIGELFGYLQKSAHGNVLLTKLDAFDNYLMSHSTNVSYLSLLLGMKLERYLIEERSTKRPRDAKDLKQLGLGCLLHDVGKMRISPEILNKSGPLTEEEMKIIQMHPVYGYEMVRRRVPATVAQVVLNHHQRYNGGGYPLRIDAGSGEPLPPITGKQIPVLVRISTICDVYDAATTKRVYSEAKLPVRVLHEMRTWCEGWFDPAIERAFYEIIPPFPIGQIVKLNSGVEAAVVDFNPEFPTRPKVQGLRNADGSRFDHPGLEEIDLAIYLDLHIESVNGIDIRPFAATQEALLETAG